MKPAPGRLQTLSALRRANSWKREVQSSRVDHSEVVYDRHPSACHQQFIASFTLIDYAIFNGLQEYTEYIRLVGKRSAGVYSCYIISHSRRLDRCRSLCLLLLNASRCTRGGCNGGCLLIDSATSFIVVDVVASNFTPARPCTYIRPLYSW